MTIEVVGDSDLTAAEKQQLIDFEVDCFETEKVRGLRKTKYFAPTFRHLILRRDNKLVSYLRIVLREASWRGRAIFVGGIGSVCTAKNERGKGYASMLLEKAMAILLEQKADIILLETNIEKGEKLYGSVGFIPAGKSYTYSDIDGVTQAAKAKDVMIAPGVSPELVTAVSSPTSPELFVGNGGW